MRKGRNLFKVSYIAHIYYFSTNHPYFCSFYILVNLLRLNSDSSPITITRQDENLFCNLLKINMYKKVNKTGKGIMGISNVVGGG